MNEAKATVMRRRWPALLAIALIFCAAVVVIISAMAGLSLASMSFGCVAAVLTSLWLERARWTALVATVGCISLVAYALIAPIMPSMAPTLVDTFPYLAMVGLGALVCILQKRTSVALRQSENKFRDFASLSADWFWESDNEHRVLNISHQFEQHTGIPASKLIGRSSRDGIIPEDSLEERRAAVDELTRTGRMKDAEWSIRTPTGELRQISVSGMRIF